MYISINQAHYETLAYVTTATATCSASSDFPNTMAKQLLLYNYDDSNVDQIKCKSFI